MSDNIKIIATGDGSHSLLNLAMDETYHSRHGALRESQHVFIRQGLEHWRQLHPDAESVHIFEMGMGTGLNLLLTLENALRYTSLQYHYLTLEAYPLNSILAQQLNYPELLGDDTRIISLFREIHQSNWNRDTQILPNFVLHKLHSRLEDYSPGEQTFDLLYYDAFAPNKQAELWTYEVMQNLHKMLRPGGVFVTYSAKGQLKRDLKSLGLVVETLDGPPGKAEMVRASKKISPD
jgi:tRNA U34 5-methylaminomethyl-2-thiouridine-forming methyltransferase MnmC